MFPGGDQHGVLDRVQDDLRIDAFFLAQYLDGLKNRFQSALDCLRLIIPAAALPLELQVGLLNLFEWKRGGLSRLSFESDFAVLESRQHAVPVAPPLQWIAQRDLRLLPLKSLVVLRLQQLPLYTRRTDFEV